MDRPGPRGHAFDAIVNVTNFASAAAESRRQAGQAPGPSAAYVEAVTRGHPLVKGIETAFVGRLGRPPELRMSKAGKPFCTFSIVVALGAEATQWLQVAAFGETAEALAGLPSGTHVYCEGQLRVEPYERKDGTSASALKVTASTAIALGQIGQRRRPAPPRKAAKRPDSRAPLDAAEHGGPNDPMPF